LAISLSADAISVFKSSRYSVTAFYWLTANLPPESRFVLPFISFLWVAFAHLGNRTLMDNIFLCGLFPGPKKPAVWRPMLRLIVNELLELWRGIEVFDVCDQQKKKVQGVLLNVVADLEARRAV